LCDNKGEDFVFPLVAVEKVDSLHRGYSIPHDSFSYKTRNPCGRRNCLRRKGFSPLFSTLHKSIWIYLNSHILGHRFDTEFDRVFHCVIY